MAESEPGTVPSPSPEGDGFEGGKTAPGEATGTRGQLDGASGGYGSQSGSASSGGSGDGEPQDSSGIGGSESTDAEASGAAGEPPTDWLRGA